jgi:RimJ/RimL family protein N-acetyltransferase
VNGRANLGYWLRAGAVGRGVTTAAVRQLLRWTFETTDFFRVEIVAAVGNHRSIRVAEKVAARREGIARSRLLVHGERHDTVIFAYLRSDPPP